MRSKAWRVPLFWAGMALLSQAFPLPSPVRDGATLAWAKDFHLVFPVWQVVFAPFCGLADAITVLSLHELYVLVAYVVFGCLLAGPKKGSMAFLLFLGFVAWGALSWRPMGRLVAQNPDILVVDFHSHTKYSHDGRPSFTPAANMRWHRLQGYGAAFITDHNRVEGAREAKEESRQTWRETGYRSLEGEEVSLQKTHLVILGNHERVDNTPYDGDFARIPVFVKDMKKRNIPVIASLPEYWFYHWNNPSHGSPDDFVRWGMSGFEIINSAPKALDFPLAYRLHILHLCRTNNLYFTGISDNHGYGYATAAWNAMDLPGWQKMDPDQLENAILARLRTGGYGAVRVLERVKFFAHTTPELLLSPFGNLVVLWRLLQPWQAVSWAAWIFLAGILYPSRKFGTQRSGPER